MLVSVIIPVKNGAKTLDKCLTAIKQQTIADQTEIIVLDSASTDESVAIAKQHGAEVVNIPEGTFNHGSTRNIGVLHAQGELLYFTVQDAYLAEQDQLERMSKHFEDEQLMAVTGMQAVPHEVNVNPALWFRRFSTPVPVYKQLQAGAYDKLSNKEQFKLTGEWDDVNAMYRKCALQQVPFQTTDFAEDKLWARGALRAGMKICFDPSLVVWHYHHSGFRYSFNLEYTVCYHFYKVFGVKPSLPSFFRPLLSSWHQVWNKPVLSFGQKMYWSLHNLLRLLGYASSVLIFLFAANVLGDKALERSFYIFCKQVPQGAIA